jgi:dipeptidyl-peptidase-3
LIIAPFLVIAPLIAAPSPLVEQIGPYGFLALETPSFKTLKLPEKLVAYQLSQAAIAVDPIIYDQLSPTGVVEKKLLGALVEKPERLPAASRAAIVRFAKLFFGNKGNHNDTTNQKILPDFTFAQLREAALAAQKAGAKLPPPPALEKLLAELQAPLFDPRFKPSITEKNPPTGQDIITGSGNNFYGPGVTLADVKSWNDPHPLNSRVVKVNGKLVEQVYRAGTPDGSIPPGLYAAELGRAIAALAEARKWAPPAQQGAIGALVTFYQTGAPADWLAFGTTWVQDDEPVDFVNGFIETYRDTRAAKGSSQALISVDDAKIRPLMQKLAANAIYFERKAPWAALYKKLDVKPPVGKAIEVLLETGDFHVTTIGDNLPNEEEIHRTHGTKNFLMTNATEAYNLTKGAATAKEFAPDSYARYQKVGSTADLLHTAMHEIIGHGSGKQRVTKEPRETLREYYSTLEEARADLVAYWNIDDPKLAELGVADQREVADELYLQLARSIFGVLNHYPHGDQAEEDHDRNRLLIWNWVRERGGIALVEKNGKHYGVVLDRKKARAAVGELLAELQRIKGEGDYAAIQKLVTDKGLRFDPKLRDETVARFKALGLPAYLAGIYGTLSLVRGADGKPSDVRIDYHRDFLRQELDHARANGTLGF